MTLLRALAALSLLSASVSAQEICHEPSVCVPEEDLEKFVALVRERKCIDASVPEFTIDSITIVTDEDGRVFHSGADPRKPYRLTMKWCHLTVVADGEVEVVAALRPPETAGFRFRPKAYLGYLPFKLADREFEAGIDAGMLIDLAFIEWANFNLGAGFRSVGAGFGVDISQNFGAYVGYAAGWTGPLHNINAALYFAF